MSPRSRSRIQTFFLQTTVRWKACSACKLPSPRSQRQIRRARWEARGGRRRVRSICSTARGASTSTSSSNSSEGATPNSSAPAPESTASFFTSPAPESVDTLLTSTPAPEHADTSVTSPAPAPESADTYLTFPAPAPPSHFAPMTSLFQFKREHNRDGGVRGLP